MSLPLKEIPGSASIVGGLDPQFESSEQAYTASTLRSVSHGLGRLPYMWRVHLRCKTANNGYAVGDEIDMTNMVDGDGARSWAVWANATTLNIRPDNASIIDTSGNFATPTAGHWVLVFYAW